MHQRRDRDRGTALIAVLIVMTLLMGIGAALHTSVVSDTSLRGAHARATAGFYAAEAGINRGMGDYRNIFLAYGVPSGSDFDVHSFALGPRTVKYQLTSVASNLQVTVPAGKPFAGLNAIENRYTATATSELQDGDVEASLGTEFDVDLIPLFQFLAFYADDLEILPGPSMNLHGPIHTNGNLYLNSNNTLTVNDCYPATGCPTAIPTVQMSAAGNVIRGRKDANTCTGTVRIAKLTDANNNGQLDLQTMGCGAGGSPSTQSSAQLATWLGAIKDRQPVVSVPTPDVLVRGSGEFWTRADLRIVLDLDTPDANGRFPIVVQAAGGGIDGARNAALQQFMQTREGRIFYSDVPEVNRDQDLACTDFSAYCNPTSYNPDFLAGVEGVYACPRSDLGFWGGCASYVRNVPLSTGAGVTARRGGFYSNRERAWVYMLNVNVRDLLAWNRAQGGPLFDPNDESDGGIVLFLSVKGPGSAGVGTPRYGVRLFGSPDLDFPAAANPTGLSVVSDQAIYVEGSYNVGNALAPKQPAAIIGDAVNVLSSNWSGSAACRNDCQSRRPLASRPGVSTTIFSAFIGGVDRTTPGSYNGGFENYPRFHEDWSGQTLTYRGSFVSLGRPQHNNGAWCGTGGGCNIYNPPGRNWDFDPDFQQVQNLPPLTPRFVSVQQILFTENFR
jgi:hypothetical protein